jgi:O-antigen/teichoic acid export membrane protein
MIQSTVGMFGVFAGFGLGLTTTKHVAEFRQSDPVRAGRIIGLSGLFTIATGGLMALGLFIFAPWLAEHTINAPHLADILRIGALILFISTLNGTQIGALSGFEAFKTIAHVNLFVGLISFPLLVCGAWFGGLTGAVWALALNLVINWFLNHLAIRKEARRYGVPFTFKQCIREWPILWKFSLPAVLTSAMVGPASWLCDAIVVNQENGYAALGIYNVAFQISIIIGTVNSMIGQAFLPICISSFRNQNERFDSLNIMFPWIIGILVALPFLCVPELWAALFGDEYFTKNTLRTVVFVAISSIIIAHRQGIARNFVAGGYMWWSLMGNLFWVILAVSFTYLLRNYGAEGRAVSFMIAYVLNTLVFIPFYVRMKLCTKYLLLSRYSLMIWIVLFFLTILVLFLQLGILFRCAILVPTYLLMFLFFRELWVKKPRDFQENYHDVD